VCLDKICNIVVYSLMSAYEIKGFLRNASRACVNWTVYYLLPPFPRISTYQNRGGGCNPHNNMGHKSCLLLRDFIAVEIWTQLYRVNAVTVQIPCYVVTSATTRFLSVHFNVHWSFCYCCWYCMQIKALDFWSCVLHKVLPIPWTVEHLYIKCNNICNCKSYVHCFNGYFHVRAGLEITHTSWTHFLNGDFSPGLNNDTTVCCQSFTVFISDLPLDI